MTHLKGLLPSNSYHCTIRQVQEDDDSEFVTLVWTVDEDTNYRWRNIFDRYYLDEYEMARLERTCESLNRDVPEDLQDLIGLRAYLDVTVKLTNNVKRNVILMYNLPTQPPHFNVTRPKTDGFYYERKQKPILPI